ncbi:hypothetical protein D018_0053B, partial [Vibrio parahaemolyticus VP2007-007]
GLTPIASHLSNSLSYSLARRVAITKRTMYCSMASAMWMSSTSWRAVKMSC